MSRLDIPVIDHCSTHLRLWLVNLSYLQALYGADFHAFVLDTVQQRLLDCGLKADEVFIQGDFVLIALGQLGRQNRFQRAHPNALAQLLGAALECDPIAHEDTRIYLHTQVAYHFDHRQYDKDLLHPPAPNPCSHSHPATLAAWHKVWAQTYRDDMTLAVQMLDDLQAGRLVLAFQPVYHLGEQHQNKYFYEEALIRHQGQADYQLPEAISALERLGLISRLDRSVLHSVVELLSAQPALCLGANLSAGSLQDDLWWQDLFSYLDSRPDVAQRLILEVTETGTIAHKPTALRLIAQLQNLGVRIALDDTGSGNSTLAFLVQTHADIIKIDRSILLRARTPGQPAHLLRNLVNVCADYSPYVVIEGVEDEADLEFVRLSGAHGVQGFLLALPTIHPHWLKPSDVITVRDAVYVRTQFYPGEPLADYGFGF
ncbi:diguanylate phosphodiesterase [Alcaligenes faecalis]|uniref:EAL domain-containing protein n=1 Tax=Alcaligenes faecalis TaxID=511 RepID=UPI000A2D0A81|nr:EAL domain-containing protein [Alcaligenes faecalis]KAA1286522.1 EAL domain-containing protein [Alcaligenes faecalis]OSZ29917.1 diguanylate phosphodiesterase [Alcaligenes faecalis]OSZ38146.1 diguanylate phosphodiesterase [Alcaligenes faecalis]